ncbi:MAG: CvpA family protein [Planctomycetota bacterium]
MIMSLVAIVIVLVVGYIWVLKGFLSALIHLMCVLIAGAVAFGVWEPLAYILTDTGPGFVNDSAWAIALIVPFAATVAILRISSDSFIRANAQADSSLDYIGGGICGVLSGAITAGVVLNGIGTMRLDRNFLGYSVVDYGNAQSIQKNSMFFPVDELVHSFYGYTSETVFSTNESLNKWHPVPGHMAGALRAVNRDNANRANNVAKPGSYRVLGSYTVGEGAGLNMRDLLTDTWSAQPHNAVDLEGNSYPGNSFVQGVWIQPDESLNEDHGQVVLGEGQVWAIAKNASTGDTILRHPVAVVSVQKGADEQFARFRFDGAEIFVGSPGATLKPMGFEFVIPSGYDIIGVSVRGIRTTIDPSDEPEAFENPTQRDLAVRSGALVPSASDLEYRQEGATIIGSVGRGQQTAEEVFRNAGFTTSSNLPFRWSMQVGQQGALDLNDDNFITRGTSVLETEAVNLRGVPRELRIRGFSVRPGLAMMHVEVTPGGSADWTNKTLDPDRFDEEIVLLDVNGNAYPAIGWAYEDRSKVHVRYTPDAPVAGISDLQSERVNMLKSRDDQKMVLMFLVTPGVEINRFAVAGQIVTLSLQPLEVRTRRR